MKSLKMFSKKNRILLRELVVTDFKLRYQGSALGYLWSILKPLFLFAIMYFVFGYVFNFRGDIEHFAVYLLLGIVLWNFFTEATNQGLQAITARGDLIRKINFPKYIIVVSGTLSAFINLGINLVVVTFFIIANGVAIGPMALILPLIVIELYVFSLSVALLLSALNVRFRDIGYLWEIALQALFYGTPILYSIGMVVDKNIELAKIMMMNPVAQVIQDARYVIVSEKTATIWSLHDGILTQLVPFAIIASVALVGVLYFRKSSKYFAEYV